MTQEELVKDMVAVMKATKVQGTALYAPHWFSPAVLESIARQLITHYGLRIS